jgi:hypothetical protein
MPQKASDLSPTEGRFTALFIGPKHAGKTVAACSFRPTNPRTPKIYDFDFDGRIRGIQGATWLDRSIIEYDYFAPRTLNGDTYFHERLLNRMNEMDSQSRLMTLPYGTVIADSLTALSTGFMNDAVPLTHEGNKGMKIRQTLMSGPEDYKFESQNVHLFLSFLRSLPVQNMICMAHVVDKYGKPTAISTSGPTKGQEVEQQYAESVVVGEKLSLRDKISASIGIYFDHIFRFDRKYIGNKEKFTVQFKSDIACTSFRGLPEGEIDITGRNFYDVLYGYVRKEMESAA